MSIAPILQRITAIETRFGGRPPVQVASAASSSVAASSIGSTSSAVDTDALFEQVMAAAEQALPTVQSATAVHTNPILAVVNSSAQFPTPVATVATATTSVSSAIPAGTPFATEFQQAATASGVPAELLAAVGWVESRYDVDAVSPDGALGVMQLMPGTAEHLGVDPLDPPDAIDGAARLLRSHFDRFGSWDLALAAYFSGGGAVAAAGNQAPPRGAEYAERVMNRMASA